MIGIYKVISPNGKIYIGQSVNIKRRWRQHKYQKLDTILSRSFKKYGFENHIFEIVEECNIELLNERERYWQDFYKAIGLNGLNSKLTQTNDKSGYVTEEVKFKLKISRIDKKEENEYLFEHEIFINDYEEKIYEYEKQKIKEQEKIKKEEKILKQQLKQQKEKDIDFYYLRLDEERERYENSIDCII